MTTTDYTPQALVQRFKPLYRLHSEEMWYPCHPEDQLRCADLVCVADGTVVIPALGAADGAPADQLLATPLGLQQLAARGIRLDAQTIDALQWQPTSSAHYAGYTPAPGFVLRRADAQFMPPFGMLTGYTPADGTWFHQGAPNNPRYWLGGDPSAYGPAIVDPSAGTVRGAWQAPVTSAWVQRHMVAGKDYIDLIYNCYLAWNGSISFLPGQGEHPNDVETFVVRLAADDLDHPVRYFFQQHGGFSWYDPAHVETNGDQVTVYLARQSHECYPHPGRYVRLYGFADDLCDAHGVSWDAPVVYLDRPAGIDGYGIDTEHLRASLTDGDLNEVLLVPLADPGPLWQYVRFRFLARRPDDVPLSTEAFLHQPFPLATTKWWPQEGPAGDTPPLSTIAAEASAPGVVPSFFLAAAPYLGPDPLPGRTSATTATTASRPMAKPVWHTPYEATGADTIPGSAIGGATAALAPNATFVNWRGGIGRYLLAGVNAQLGNWMPLLPDPLAVGTVNVGPVTLADVQIQGLRGSQVAPAAAIAPDTLQVFANTPQLRFSGTVSIAGGAQGIALSATVSSFAVRLAVRLVTPVAVPSSDAGQWYVPYVGPLSYSYATAPFATTRAINDASVASLAISYDTIDVDTGNAGLDKVIDLVLQGLRSILEGKAATALEDGVNARLASLYDGTLRIE